MGRSAVSLVHTNTQIQQNFLHRAPPSLQPVLTILGWVDVYTFGTNTSNSFVPSSHWIQLIQTHVPHSKQLLGQFDLIGTFLPQRNDQLSVGPHINHPVVQVHFQSINPHPYIFENRVIFQWTILHSSSWHMDFSLLVSFPWQSPCHHSQQV